VKYHSHDKIETMMGTRLPKLHVFSPLCGAKQENPKLQLEICSIWVGLEDTPWSHIKKKQIGESAQYDPKLPAKIPIPILKK
jgi:hypothetical protein